MEEKTTALKLTLFCLDVSGSMWWAQEGYGFWKHSKLWVAQQVIEGNLHRLKPDPSSRVLLITFSDTVWQNISEPQPVEAAAGRMADIFANLTPKGNTDLYGASNVALDMVRGYALLHPETYCSARIVLLTDGQDNLKRDAASQQKLKERFAETYKEPLDNLHLEAVRMISVESKKETAAVKDEAKKLGLEDPVHATEENFKNVDLSPTEKLTQEFQTKLAEFKARKQQKEAKPKRGQVGVGLAGDKKTTGEIMDARGLKPAASEE